MVAPEYASSAFHRLSRVYDRVGNYISLHYGAHDYGSGGPRGGGSSVTRLDEIDDSAGQPLLTLGFNSSTGRYASANDRYGRSVYYTPADFDPFWGGMLGDVSQIVATGTPPPRCAIGTRI